jgi:hypothetical protein
MERPSARGSRNGAGITSRLDIENAAERREERSHAERGNEGPGSLSVRFQNREVIPALFPSGRCSGRGTVALVSTMPGCGSAATGY